MKERTRLFRLPPCPPYDVEATESWLEDMAAQGWMLEKAARISDIRHGHQHALQSHVRHAAQLQ